MRGPRDGGRDLRPSARAPLALQAGAADRVLRTAEDHIGQDPPGRAAHARKRARRTRRKGGSGVQDRGFSGRVRASGPACRAGPQAKRRRAAHIAVSEPWPLASSWLRMCPWRHISNARDRSRRPRCRRRSCRRRRRSRSCRRARRHSTCRRPAGPGPDPPWRRWRGPRRASGKRGGGDRGSGVHEEILRVNNSLGSGAAAASPFGGACRPCSSTSPLQTEVTGVRDHEFVNRHVRTGRVCLKRAPH